MGLLTAAGGRADAACEIDLPSVCPGEPYGSGGSDTTCDALCIDVAPGAPVTLRCDLGARRDHDLGAHARAFGADPSQTGRSYALIPAAGGSKGGVGGLAIVTAFHQAVKETSFEESVWLFDGVGPGTITTDGAVASLRVDGDLDLGPGMPTWGGDVDADGGRELVVPFDGTHPTFDEPGGIGGVFIVVPPSSGVAELLDAQHVVRHEGGELLNVDATLSGHSWEGDPCDDPLLGQFHWNPDDPSDDGDFGRALLFQGGPKGC